MSAMISMSGPLRRSRTFVQAWNRWAHCSVTRPVSRPWIALNRVLRSFIKGPKAIKALSGSVRSEFHRWQEESCYAFARADRIGPDLAPGRMPTRDCL